MKKLHVITIAFLTFMSALANAQNVTPVDFMDTNPYQLRNNPSVVMPYDSHVSVVIGNICGDFRNLNFRLENAFGYDAFDRPTVIDLKQLANSLNPENSMNSTFDMEVLGLGRKLRHGYLTYSHRVRFQSNCNYTDDLFQLAASGNAAFETNRGMIKWNAMIVVGQKSLSDSAVRFALLDATSKEVQHEQDYIRSRSRNRNGRRDGAGR